MEAGEGGVGRESPALAYGGGGGGGGQGENEYAAEGYPNYGGNGHQVHGEEAPAAGAAVAFPTSVYRESLGFLRARKKLTLPGVGMEPGEVDGGTLAGLAVMERFGFLLVSCSTGERVREREKWTIIHTSIRQDTGGLFCWCWFWCWCCASCKLAVNHQRRV